MTYLKKIAKGIGYILLIPITYLLIAGILTTLTVNKTDKETPQHATIYLSTNGVHLDIILAKKNIDPALLKDLKHHTSERYIAFGWGNEDFYINTPNWADLTFKKAITALFLDNTTLMHVSRYVKKETDWVAIPVTQEQLHKLNIYLIQSFKLDEANHKIRLRNKGYSYNDDFYKAKGRYSCLKTCNTWVNSAFKNCRLKACVWTPFDFGLLNKYQ